MTPSGSDRRKRRPLEACWRPSLDRQLILVDYRKKRVWICIYAVVWRPGSLALVADLISEIGKTSHS